MNNPSEHLVERWRAFEAAHLAWHEHTITTEAFDEAKSLFVYAASSEVAQAVAVSESLTSPAVLKVAA